MGPVIKRLTTSVSNFWVTVEKPAFTSIAICSGIRIGLTVFSNTSTRACQTGISFCNKNETKGNFDLREEVVGKGSLKNPKTLFQIDITCGYKIHYWTKAQIHTLLIYPVRYAWGKRGVPCFHERGLFAFGKQSHEIGPCWPFSEQVDKSKPYSLERLQFSGKNTFSKLFVRSYVHAYI